MATALSKEDSNAVDERTKPPFLRRVRIRGYKSIAFCDVSLQPLTILVGRNAAGKSNFLDALAFLRDAMDTSVREAAWLHGGGKAVQCRTTDQTKIEMRIDAAFESFQTHYLAEYSIELAVKVRGLLKVERESLRIHDPARNRTCGFDARRGKANWMGLEHFGPGNGEPMRSAPGEALDKNTPPYPHLFDSYRPDRLLLGVIGSQPFLDLNEGLRNSGFYNFHPEAMRLPWKPTPGSLLKRDGSNVASLIDSLKEIEPEAVDRVQQYLSTIAEEVHGFDVVRYGEYDTVRFQVRPRQGKAPLKLDAASMSDGTLRALAALMAVFQIVLPHGHPGIVGIEEPETALHPAAMRALVDALDEATQRTQVLLTTHSADLLSGREVTPGQVLVVRNRDGQTQIAPVDAASREIIQKELYSLADLQRMDRLDVDEADLRRQAQLSNGTEGA